MSILQKIRNLPESQRKIILWVTVTIIGILIFAFYIKNLSLKLKNLKSEEIEKQLKIPEFQKRLENIPKIEMPRLELPQISEEELKELEEKLKELEKLEEEKEKQLKELEELEKEKQEQEQKQEQEKQLNK